MDLAGPALRRDRSSAASREVPVIILTYSLRLFNVMIRTSTINTEKRLMVDIAPTSKAYENRESSEICCSCSGDNFGDSFTKIKR